MSHAKLPPIPPAGRSPAAGGRGAKADPASAHQDDKARPESPIGQNFAEQGNQGNIAQNTRNTGHQQDR